MLAIYCKIENLFYDQAFSPSEIMAYVGVLSSTSYMLKLVGKVHIYVCNPNMLSDNVGRLFETQSCPSGTEQHYWMARG